MRVTKMGAVTALGLVIAAAPASANDRPPTAEERAAIERSLRAQGYVSWDDIELDDGRWEIHNARRASGRKFDLKLDPRTLRVIRRERDD
jgi:hypothetical protein